MATKKSLQKAEVNSNSYEKTSAKEIAHTKENVLNRKSALQIKKPIAHQDEKSTKPPVKNVTTDKVIQPAGKLTKKDVKIPVEKKSKEPVKKTTTQDTVENKKVAESKKATDEKRSKSDIAVEKEPKKSTAKAAKVNIESERNNKPVVLPKMSTDKKVDYEPDFLKSVLDAPAVSAGAPTMRYSDTELQEFRDLINKKLDAAKKELAYLQGLITRRDEMGGDETDNRYMTMEDGGMSMEREQLSQMASRQITFIDHLEKAIMRIENKTYGICRVTGKLIDKARLRAVPHATLSMEAKLGITK